MAEDTTEELEKLRKEVAALSKTMSSSSKTLLKESRSKKIFVNLQKVLNRSYIDYEKKVKAGEGTLHEFSDALEAGKKDVKNFGMALKATPLGIVSGALGFLKDAVVAVGTAMIKTAISLSDVTKDISNLESLLEGMEDIPVAGKLINELGREVDANTEVFMQLAKSGASFGSSIVMLRKASYDAGMPLAKFTDLIGSNTGMLAKLFGSVDQGVPQIAGLTRSLRDITQNEFAKFGLTLEDTSGYLTTFLELERARGNTTRFTQAQLLDGTREYTKNLVTLSKLTGQSVEELNNQNMAMAADGVFQSQLSKMAAGDAKTLSLGISQLPGPLQQLAKEVIGLGAPISDTSRELTAMSGGAFNEAIKQFQNTGDLVAFQNSIKTISGNVMQNAEAFGDAALAGGGFTEALNAVVAAIGAAVDPEDLDKEMTARGDNIETLVSLRDTTDLLKTEFEDLRFKILKPFIYEDGPKLLDVVGGLETGMRKLQEETLPKLNAWIDGVSKSGFFKKDNTETGTSTSSNFNSYKEQAKSYGYHEIPPVGTPEHDDWINAQIKRYKNFQFKDGTDGFQNFGTGTPAMLHGEEAVVPKDSLFGTALTILTQLKNKATATTTGTGATAVAEDQTVHTSSLAELVKLNESNQKVANHLNKLITIGAMTEKNTKDTKNNLANVGSSLV